MTHDSKPLTHTDLHHFTGTENWYRHPFVRQVLYTDGAQYVAEKGGAYWLLDEIAFAQKGNPRVAAEPFQVWKLQVEPDQTATLSCENGNGTPVTAKQLDYTDFPLPEITFYFTNNVILLPSEY
jgi:hypothetical protein